MIHALWMIVLTFFGLRVPHTTDEEMKLIQWTSAWKRIYLKNERPASANFIFINVAWEKQYVPKTDANGFIIGNDVITNRKKLARLVNLLNEKPDNHKFLVMDIRFEERFSRKDLENMGLTSPSEYDSLSLYDSLLSTALVKTKNCIISYHADVEGNLKPPVFPVMAGLSNYETTSEGTIIKFSAIQADTARTTPLLIHQALHHSSYSKGFLFDTMNGRFVLKSFILDHRILIHPWEFTTNDYYHHAYLGELLQMPDSFIHELTKDKIIVVGDFEDRDIHETIYGAMPGPIILLNAFLAFENRDNIITLGFIAFLFISYTLISYRCFSQINLMDNLLINRLPFPNEAKKMIGSLAGYLVLLIVMSIISYFLFNVHLTILLLAIYLQLLEWVIAFINKKRKTNSAPVFENLKTTPL